MTSAPPLLRLEGVTWVADRGLPSERTVLDGVTLELEAAARVGIVGRSGAGKTTLATIAAGLLDPSAGRVLFRGQPGGASDERAFTGEVGLVFQEPERGFFEETVLADVGFGARNAGLTAAEVRARTEDALRAVGLSPERFGQRAPESLSAGEARRAAIAGVLVLEPAFVLFDEPTTGLDADGLQRFRSLLAGLRERGAGYAVISHDLPLLVEECDRVLVLDGGTIVQDGPPSELASGLPDAWSDDAALWGGDLPVLAEALRERGLLDAGVPSTPEAMAAAVAAALGRGGADADPAGPALG